MGNCWSICAFGGGIAAVWAALDSAGFGGAWTGAGAAVAAAGSASLATGAGGAATEVPLTASSYAAVILLWNASVRVSVAFCAVLLAISSFLAVLRACFLCFLCVFFVGFIALLSGAAFCFIKFWIIFFCTLLCIISFCCCAHCDFTCSSIVLIWFICSVCDWATASAFFASC